MEELKKKVDLLKKQSDELRDKLKEKVRNKSIPLKDRWETFLECNLGEHSGWYPTFKSVDLDEYLGSGMVSRYQTIPVEYIDEWVEENHPDKIDDFREEALEQFYKSFEYDW